MLLLGGAHGAASSSTDLPLKTEECRNWDKLGIKRTMSRELDDIDDIFSISDRILDKSYNPVTGLYSIKTKDGEFEAPMDSITLFKDPSGKKMVLMELKTLEETLETKKEKIKKFFNSLTEEQMQKYLKDINDLKDKKPDLQEFLKKLLDAKKDNLTEEQMQKYLLDIIALIDEIKKEAINPDLQPKAINSDLPLFLGSLRDLTSRKAVFVKLAEYIDDLKTNEVAESNLRMYLELSRIGVRYSEYTNNLSVNIEKIEDNIIYFGNYVDVSGIFYDHDLIEKYKRILTEESWYKFRRLRGLHLVNVYLNLLKTDEYDIINIKKIEDNLISLESDLSYLFYHPRGKYEWILTEESWNRFERIRNIRENKYN